MKFYEFWLVANCRRFGRDETIKNSNFSALVRFQLFLIFVDIDVCLVLSYCLLNNLSFGLKPRVQNTLKIRRSYN